MSLIDRDNCGDTYDASTIGLFGWVGGFRGIVPGRVAGGAIDIGQPTPISFDTLAKQAIALGSEFTWHCGYQSQMTPSGNAVIFGFTEGGTTHVDVRINSSGILFVTRNGTTVATGTTPLTPGVWYQLNAHIKVHDTTGEVHITLEGASEISATGLDTRNGGTGVCDGYFIRGTSTPNHRSYFDDIHIWSGNDDHGLTRVLGRVAVADSVAAGTYDDWTTESGSDHGAMVDDNPPDGDTTYVQSDTGGNRDSYRLQPLGISPSATVYALVVGAIARKLDIGPRVLAMFVRTGAADFDGGDKNPSYDYQQMVEVYEANPDTTSAWTTAEIDAVEVGILDNTP